MTIKMTDPDELYDLMKVLRCLIDTAERTTDLEGAYNDKADEYVSWAEIHKALPCVEDRCHINRLVKQVKDLTKQLALYREYVVADMEVTKHIPETPTHTKSGGYRDSEHRRAHSVAWTRKHAAMAALPEDKTDG